MQKTNRSARTDSAFEGYIVSEILMIFESIDLAILLLTEQSIKWQYVTLSIYTALYNLCISILHNGDYERVLIPINKVVYPIWFTDDEICYKGVKDIQNGIDKFYNIIWTEATKEDCEEFNILTQVGDKKYEEKKLKKYKEYKEYNESLNQDKIDKESFYAFYEFNYNNLIPFYDAIAWVMDGQCKMRGTILQKPLILTNEELNNISTIHTYRNDFMHFKPKTSFMSPDKDFRICLETYIKAIEFLLFESHSNIHWEQISAKVDNREDVRQKLQILKAKLNKK